MDYLTIGIRLDLAVHRALPKLEGQERYELASAALEAVNALLEASIVTDSNRRRSKRLTRSWKRRS